MGAFVHVIQHFRLVNDMDTGRRGFATVVSELDSMAAAHALVHDGRWSGPPPRIEVSPGWLPDWNLLSGWSVPLVSRRAADVIARLARPAVQRIPVEVPGAEGHWELLGIPTIDCADGNPRDPFQAVFPVIDASRTRDSTLFHLPSLMIIARQEIHDAFREQEITGARFVPAAVR
jgi:hypothetical protein